jgi:hypothetical protein
MKPFNGWYVVDSDTVYKSDSFMIADHEVVVIPRDLATRLEEFLERSHQGEYTVALLEELRARE